MSLNKFFNTNTGLDIDLRIGADEVKANNMQTTNIDVSTINGVPYLPGGSVTNPLTSDLKLDGYSIIEELASLSPSLNIDQLNNTKDIKLKVAGISKVDIKNNEIQLNENLNMNSNEIKNVSVIDNSSGNLQIIGQSTTSAVELDPNPTDGVNITTGSKNINVISNNDLLLKSNTSFLDIDSNLIRFLSTGTPQGQIDAVGGYEFFNALSMTNNNINNVNVLGATQVNTDTIENSGSGFLTFTNLGSYTPSFTAGGLDMNDAELLSVNNIRTNVQPILTINKNGSNATEIYGNSTIRRLQISNGVYLLSGTDLFCGNNNIQQCGNLEVSTINNITAVGGLYASTSDGVLINNTTLTSLTPSSSVGSLNVPPNGFSVGDCFHLVISGDCVFTNGDEIQITLKQNGNILAQTPVFNLEDANSGDNVFEIEADFNIRSIGATGSIHTSFEFTYNKDSLDSKDFRGTRSNDTQPIDTTIVSALDVEFQFISKNASSTIQTQLFRLQKVF